jgi:hypothetical protein
MCVCVSGVCASLSLPLSLSLSLSLRMCACAFLGVCACLVFMRVYICVWNRPTDHEKIIKSLNIYLLTTQFLIKIENVNTDFSTYFNNLENSFQP